MERYYEVHYYVTPETIIKELSEGDRDNIRTSFWIKVAIVFVFVQMAIM